MGLDKGITIACNPSLVLNALGYSVLINVVGVLALSDNHTKTKTVKSFSKYPSIISTHSENCRINSAILSG
jgi:hypothetical protein